MAKERWDLTRPGGYALKRARQRQQNKDLLANTALYTEINKEGLYN